MTPETPAIPFRIVPMEARDAYAVGRLYAESIPQAIFARLSGRFTAAFMRWIHEQEHAHVWVARDEHDRIVGAIGGTLDRPATYARMIRAHRWRIALGVLADVYRPAVWSWILHAVWERWRPTPEPPRTVPRPAAELLVIAVTPQTRGSGLAWRLVEVMEAQFRAWGFDGVYKILTLSTNDRANAFYRRIGATLAVQVPTRGLLVNEYHKRVVSDGA
jgi:ribosomal protein S18 acetylase RimI-like enzyme